LRKFYKHQQNEYFSDPGDTVLEKILHQEEIHYTSILLGYPSNGWSANLDLFQYLDPVLIEDLKNKKTILIVDYTFEGFGHIYNPIIEILEKNSLKYELNPKQIFYCSGNLKDRSLIINTLPIYTLDYSYNFRDNQSKIFGQSFKSAKRLCEKRLSDKICLSLSRRNRPHRVLAHAMLFNSPISNLCLISQDKVENLTLNPHMLGTTELNETKIKKFIDSLPLIADHNRFHINEPFNPLFKLHAESLFSIVNETLNDDEKETSLFFSEKILKPIINFQPMIIWGQKNINKSLTKLGFKTYDSYFDYDFDSEVDNVLRYKKLLDTITPLVNHLNTLDRDKKIAWRFKDEDLLKYNYNVFIENTQSKKQKEIFLQKIKEIFHSI
jgi:hypothetical protein